MQPTHQASSPERTVRTVLGPIRTSRLGLTLTHEHLLTDVTEAWHPGSNPLTLALADQPVTARNAWLLREDAYCCKDNCLLDDEDIACDELSLLAQAGGTTVVDNTTGTARNPSALVRIAKRTGLNIIMGSGWSLAHGTDDTWKGRNPDQLANQLSREIHEGIQTDDGYDAHPGIIGEIGVGPNFTASERLTLIAAARAQTQTSVPLFIHLPGWQRRAHEVLDIVTAEGVHPGAVVLCHMDPSGTDPVYQREIASRGAWLEFDMIGMQCNFPGEGRAPTPDQTATAVAALARDGYAGQLLLSHDVFLKSMLTRNGGNGYAYIPAIFANALDPLLDGTTATRRILTANPRNLFLNA